MTYTRSQNYTNMMVGEHGIQTLRVMAVVLLFLLLSFDNFVVPKVHISHYLWTSELSI